MTQQTPWFKLKLKSHRWWHWVVHPVRTYRIQKYLAYAQKKIQGNMPQEKVDKYMFDMLAYGHAEWSEE